MPLAFFTAQWTMDSLDNNSIHSSLDNKGSECVTAQGFCFFAFLNLNLAVSTHKTDAHVFEILPELHKIDISLKRLFPKRF